MKKYNRGDGPCDDCKTLDNPVWFTDNVFWNDVMGKEGGNILCPQCFVERAESKYSPTGWRFVPEFKWSERKKPRRA